MTEVEKQIKTLELKDKALIAATLANAAMHRMNKNIEKIEDLTTKGDASNAAYDVFKIILEKML